MIVLIVEDDESILDLIEIYLEKLSDDKVNDEQNIDKGYF